MEPKVGLVGVGIMGSAIALNLMKAGFSVVGCDVDAGRMQALAAAGGIVAGCPREVAEQADVVLTLLPGVDILHEVVTAPDGFIAARKSALVVADCGTFDIPGKERCRVALEAAGMAMLDCTISGTGAQARTGDLVVYASGGESGYEACVPVFSGFARASHYVGVFGNGSKVKYIANLLVAIHTAATAEAMVLAQRAGLDLQTVYELVKSGGATSRMFEVRGPSMVAGEYDKNVASKLELWQKDMLVIGGFAKGLNCPVPLFAQSAQIYNAAIAQGLGKSDMAAVCAVLEGLAGIERSRTAGATAL
jgi:3-hydroxyisobutyrate dehydrogenase-like beta-hydroxyacid dehydrogenase